MDGDRRDLYGFWSISVRGGGTAGTWIDLANGCEECRRFDRRSRLCTHNRIGMKSMMGPRVVMYDGMMFLVLLPAAVASGCGTFFRPTATSPPTSLVTIESEPAGAEVRIDDVRIGETPVVTQLSRRRSVHELHLELDECVPAEYKLRRSTSRWRALVAVLFGTATGMGGALESGVKAVPISLVTVVAAGWWSGGLFELPGRVRVPLRCGPARARVMTGDGVRNGRVATTVGNGRPGVLDWRAPVVAEGLDEVGAVSASRRGNIRSTMTERKAIVDAGTGPRPAPLTSEAPPQTDERVGLRIC